MCIRPIYRLRSIESIEEAQEAISEVLSKLSLDS